MTASADTENTHLLPTASRRRLRAVLGEVLHPQRGTAVLGLLALIAATAASLLAAPLLGRIVDTVVQGRGSDAITGPVLGLIGIAVAQGALAAVGISLVARIGETLLAQLRQRFVERALGLPLRRLERAGAGDLTSRITDDVSTVAEAVREALPEFARAALLISLTMVGIVALDWRLLLGALMAVPLQVWTARWYLTRSSPIYGGLRIAYGDQQQQLLDTTAGVATVRAFRLREEHIGKVRHRAEEIVRLSMRVIGLQTRFFGRLNGAEFVGLAGVLVAGFVLVGNGVVTIGTASAAALYFINLFTPINVLLFQLDAAQAALAGLRRIVGVADLPAEPEPSVPVRPRGSRLLARGLTHSYVDGLPVLHEISLDVEAGTRVALVGPSGAGKTTLAKLVAGLHEPSSGRIEIGGAALRELGAAERRRTVGLVTQEVHVFAGTLAEDLRLADADADDDRLRDALRTVGALDWALELPDGLRTVVGEGGVELSAVQCQQISLARIVLADRPVVILDEATAEAGSAGARLLERGAEAALEGRTAIVVAHRLSQAATADRVVVMEHGRITEHGTHAELIAADGTYSRLWATWAGLRPADVD